VIGLASEPHTLDEDFMGDLRSGILVALRHRVANDDTLMLGLRNSYINLYYRGGSVLKLTRGSSGAYTPFFDVKYGQSAPALVAGLPRKITNSSECGEWVAALPALKEIMNEFLANRPKAEREFQQLVVWENNRSAVANGSEYFVSDIEFTNETRDARIDMLALKWRAADRRSGTRCAPVVIEMKWGDDAYDGSAGIKKHIADIERILGNAEEAARIGKMIGKQISQLYELGMLRFNWSAGVTSIEPLDPLEVVFILANHNPRSTKLLKVLETIKEPETFVLRFFVASFSGYGMHEACMLDLAQFKNLVAGYSKIPERSPVSGSGQTDAPAPSPEGSARTETAPIESGTAR